MQDLPVDPITRKPAELLIMSAFRLTPSGAIMRMLRHLGHTCMGLSTSWVTTTLMVDLVFLDQTLMMKMLRVLFVTLRDPS